MISLEWFLIGMLACLFVGQVAGSMSANWGWRMSGQSDHQSHKSGGKWFHVEPADEWLAKSIAVNKRLVNVGNDQPPLGA